MTLDADQANALIAINLDDTLDKLRGVPAKIDVSKHGEVYSISQMRSHAPDQEGVRPNSFVWAFVSEDADAVAQLSGRIDLLLRETGLT